MDENKINCLMDALDNDLIINELDEIMNTVDINTESISRKAQWKLRKELNNIKKRKKRVAAFMAACLIAVCGVTTVYADEISNFVQALLNKTSVYSTVVEGSTYYLESPLALENNQSLTNAMFDLDGLNLRLVLDTRSKPNIKVVLDGKEVSPSGFMIESDGVSLSFYGVAPTESFDLMIDNQSYHVILSESTPIVDGNKIVESKPNEIQWISIGCKKTQTGIQILSDIQDDRIKLLSLMIPNNDTVAEHFDKSGLHSNYMENQPLFGYDKNGKKYEYRCDPNDMGRPQTMFTTDAPTNQAIELKIPGIVVSSEIEYELDVLLPSVGKEEKVTKTVDLGLQQMVLRRVERTSQTTATIEFVLNTGENEKVRILDALLLIESAESGDILWENGICTINIVVDENIPDLKLSIFSPNFIVDGNWVLNI